MEGLAVPVELIPFNGEYKIGELTEAEETPLLFIYIGIEFVLMPM